MFRRFGGRRNWNKGVLSPLKLLLGFVVLVVHPLAPLVRFPEASVCRRPSWGEAMSVDANQIRLLWAQGQPLIRGGPRLLLSFPFNWTVGRLSMAVS